VASGGDGEKSEAELEAAKWAEMAAKMEVGLTPWFLGATADLVAESWSGV
jgi:hypothetical protein